MKRFVIGIAAALMVGALCGCDASVQEDVARLDIAPEPDSLLRVFMAWQPLDKPLEITPPTFVPFVREGFRLSSGGYKSTVNKQKSPHQRAFCSCEGTRPSVHEIGGEGRDGCDTFGRVCKIALEPCSTAAAKVLVERGFIPHLFLEAPDMGKIALLHAGEQRFQIG